MHIVIVEDQIELAELMKTMLEDRGHTVAIYPTRWQAAQQLQQLRPEVVISDYLIPNDIEMAAFLNAIKKLSSLKCVIIMSGYKEGRQLALEMNADFLPKPFTIREVTDKIDACKTPAAS